ncbi:MAG TPA: zinc-binding dehydrogenase [Mycobacteriales bacterium]|jgi:NADPH:quinone reductase-like Zn-dependent oxidoreductase|nr:zinc-binding dehydrogenase [Mycobacteriales bacterium]
MLAAYASRISPDDPLSALEVGELEAPAPPSGWVTVAVKAAALNHHDLWSLRGVGLPEDRLPMILGCDAAGVDADGNDIIVHAVIGDPDRGGGDETMDPKRSLLSERHPGTIAEQVSVPARNLVAKPAELSWEQAASIPTAWLTAYRMLFVRGRVQPGETVLVQGAGGGVATAAIALGRAAGLRVWATSRSEAKRAQAAELGADQSFESGARLPERVDAVIETVGEATFGHSLKSVRPGGRVVVCGSTSGPTTQLELQRLFFLQLEVVGSTMGTKAELERLLGFLVATGVRPIVDSTYPLSDAREGFARLAAGDMFGKVVITT